MCTSINYFDNISMDDLTSEKNIIFKLINYELISGLLIAL